MSVPANGIMIGTGRTHGCAQQKDIQISRNSLHLALHVMMQGNNDSDSFTDNITTSKVIQVSAVANGPATLAYVS